MQQFQQLRTCHFLSILKHSHSKNTDLRPILCHQPAFLEEGTRHLPVPTVKHGCRSIWEPYPYPWHRLVLIFPAWKNVSRRMTQKHQLHSKAKCETRPCDSRELSLLLLRELGLFKLEKVVLSASRDIPSPGEQAGLVAGRESSLVQQSTGTVSSTQDFDAQHPALLGNQAQLLQELFHPVQDDSAMHIYFTLQGAHLWSRISSPLIPAISVLLPWCFPLHLPPILPSQPFQFSLEYSSWISLVS